MTNDIERDPAYSDDNLIWIDMEMTGLQPEVNRVIEVAAIVSSKVKSVGYITLKASEIKA